jgi:hypothetical protein
MVGGALAELMVAASHCGGFELRFILKKLCFIAF